MQRSAEEIKARCACVLDNESKVLLLLWKQAVVRLLPTKWSLLRPKTFQRQKPADGLRYFVGTILLNIARSFQPNPATSTTTRHRQKRREDNEERNDVP